MATIKDVAKLAGVSIATVSHVINNTCFVSETTAQKVHTAIKELHYERNILGVAFRKQSSNLIGIIAPFLPQFEFSNSFYMWIMLGGEPVLSKANYSFLLGNSEENDEVTSTVIRQLKKFQIEGMLLALPVLNQKRIIAELADMPVVFIDREPSLLPDGKYDVVLSDSRTSMYNAVTEQIRRGKKKFGIINGSIINDDPSMLSNVKHRYDGFRQALKDNKIPYDMTYSVTVLPSDDLGYSAAKQLFLKHSDIDSLFITMNSLGSGALKYILESGRKVPEDVNITVFDDTLWNKVITPSLTTITQNPKLIGEIAGEVLLDKLRNPKHVPQKHYVPNELIIRNSWN